MPNVAKTVDSKYSHQISDHIDSMIDPDFSESIKWDAKHLALVDVEKYIKHKKFYQLSGEDVTQLGFLAQGGDGVISVTANIAPKKVSDLHKQIDIDNDQIDKVIVIMLKFDLIGLCD